MFAFLEVSLFGAVYDGVYAGAWGLKCLGARGRGELPPLQAAELKRIITEQDKKRARESEAGACMERLIWNELEMAHGTTMISDACHESYHALTERDYGKEKK